MSLFVEQRCSCNKLESIDVQPENCFCERYVSPDAKMSVMAFQGVEISVLKPLTKPVLPVQMLRTWPIGIGSETRWLTHWLPAIFCGFILFLGGNSLFAQCPVPGTVKPGFTLDKTKACVGYPIAITIPASVSNDLYVTDYDGKTPITSLTAISRQQVLSKPLSYNKPGSYTILQGGSGNGNASGFIYCQTVDVLPLDPVKFTVKVCSGRKAIVTVGLDASTGQYDNFVIHWDDGTNSTILSRAEIVNPQSHTYLNNAPYTIYITGSYAAPATCGTDIIVAKKAGQTVSFSATTNPVITKLTTNGDNSITLQYQAGTGTQVQLWQKDAAGVYAPTQQVGSSSGSFTVQTDAKQVQCFQVVNQDACDNTAGAKSEQVCSLVLDAKAVNKQNNLTWQAYAGSVSTTSPFRYYQITRNGSPTGGTLTNKSTASYVDANKIDCGIQYCYTLQATIGAATVVSAPACVVGVNSDVPGSFGNIAVSVESNHPKLLASLPTTGTSASYTIVISRASSLAGPFQQIGTSNNNTFVDESADASAGSYCYQLTYQNNCGLSSAPSQPVCTVYLSSKSAAGIDWTAASPFAPGSVASYVLEIVDSVNNTKREVVLGGNTHYEPDPNDPNLQSQRFRVLAISAGGIVSYSNFFTFRRDPKIIVPDAFTPNGDGMNDEFLVKGIFLSQFRMIVYSRWGEVVFSSTDRAKGWDGTIGGQPALEGQYMYRIEVVDLTDQKTVRTGAVLLLR